MREVDRLTTEQFGIPGLMLMEAAAERTVEAIENKFGTMTSRSVLVVSGRGNNGGDGAAIARLFHARGATVKLLLIGRIADARGETLSNLESLKALASNEESGPVLVEIQTADQFRIEAASQLYDVVVDAMFGTGLTRPASGIFEEAIDCLNQLRDETAVVAVDVPSGAPSDSADLIGPALEDWAKWGQARHDYFLRAADLARAITFVAETPRGGFIANMELQPEAPLADNTDRQKLALGEEGIREQ